MILPHIDRRSPTPLFRQIHEQIAAWIDAAALRPGAALPSTRLLAGRLGVDRATVCRAYQELWAQGYVQASAGSYTRVRERRLKRPPLSAPDDSWIDWGAISAPNAAGLAELDRRLEDRLPAVQGGGVIDFARFDMDPALFPADDFRRSLNRVLRGPGRSLLGYGEAAGFPPLRDYIAHRLQTHGIALGAEDILITSGSQSAIDMMLRLLVVPGAAVAVEEPTYGMVLPLLRYYGARLVSLPMTEAGLDLQALARCLEKDRPVCLYTMPTFHNPTGVTSGQAHREELLSLCERHRVPVIEDGYDEEMKYFGEVILPIKAMDRYQTVVYLGTFSKVLFPGIRIGWLAAARDCVRRLTAMRRFSELSLNPVLQAAMSEFCRRGGYDRHVRRMHSVYRRRMRLVMQALRRHLPAAACWSEPSGGYLVWVKLPGFDSKRLIRAQSAHGVRTSPGEAYFAQPPEETYLRICISGVAEDRLEEGVRRLGLALNDARAAE